MRKACPFLAFILIPIVAANELAVESEWTQWKLRHNKQYSSENTESVMRAVWLKNKKYIEDRKNSADVTGYSLQMNSFGDLVSDRVHLCYSRVYVHVHHVCAYIAIYL